MISDMTVKELGFDSQVCTTLEQSQRLLALGLKPETADMAHIAFGGGGMMTRPYDWLCTTKVEINNFYPAWSLHRLIGMCNKTQYGMTISIYNDEVTVDGDLFEVLDNTYDNLISVIEWLIKGGHFKKEYLKID